MSEEDRMNDEQIESLSDQTESLFDDMSDRVNRTMEDIAELSDDIEELSSDIKLLLDDLRTIQNSLEQHNREKLEPLIDQFEGVSVELANAVWTMDCVKQGLPEDIDVSEILHQPVQSSD